jgi:predicted phosphodiesterase
MRIGIFSDVHANIEALTEVLRTLRARDVDQYVCLGDIIGYGADPEPCVRAIREVTTHTILGNHDAAGCGRMNLHEYYAEAREAIIYSWSRLNADDREWIRGLPYSVRQGDILFCHGAPHAPEQFEYLFSEEQAEDYRQDFSTLPGVTFIGHSHLTVGFSISAKHVAGFVEPEGKWHNGHQYLETSSRWGPSASREIVIRARLA